MASNTLSTKANICDAALALLRQDVGYAANTTVAAKCDNVWYVAWDALRNAHGWQTQMGNPTDTDATIAALPIMLRSLLVYAVARELAIPITGRQEDLKTVNALFAQKVREAAIADITAYAESQTDAFTKEVMLDCLTGIMKSAEAPVPHSTAAFSSLVTSLKTTAEQEVRKTLSIAAATVLDNLALAAIAELVLNRLSTAVGLSEQYAQLHAQLYEARIAEWRKVKLNEWLETNSDPILAQLIANFKADDPGLLNIQTVYTQRVADVKTQSEATVKDILGITTLTGAAADAAVALSVAKLAPACGLDASIVKVMTDRYMQIVEQAKRDAIDNIVTAANQTVEPFKSCMDEVKKTLGITASHVTDALAIAAAKELTAANHGESYGYDANYAARRLNEYHKKIIQWRKVTLDSARTSDDILAQLVGSFKGDDEALANAWSSYETRKGSVLAICQNLAKKDFEQTTLDDASTAAANILAVAKLAPGFGLDTSFTKAQYDEYDRILTEHKQRQFTIQADTQSSTLFQSCLNEVKKLLDVTGTTTDPIVLGAASALCYVRNGARAKFDANVIALKKQEYDAKVLEYRKLQLDTAMKTNSDPILAQLVANFKGDDVSLVNAFVTYTNRVAAVKTKSEDSVKEALSLQTLTGRSADAAISLSVAKLAESCGLDANFVQLKMQEADKLVAAVKRDQLDNDVKTNGTMATACANEVRKALGLSDGTTLDAVQSACAFARCYAKHGVQYGYDANFVQLKEQEYAAKLQHAKKAILDAAIASNTDPVLAQLVENFKADDPSIMTAFTVYTRRSSTVKAESDKEVKKVLGIATLDDLAQQASNCLSVSHLATSCGLDANVVQLKTQEYQTKILQWRKVKLDADRTDDEVLSQLVGYFKGDDTALCNAWSAYTARSARVKEMCDAAVAEAFGVTVSQQSPLSGVPKLASNCLAVAKLAPAFGLDCNVAATQMAEYDKLLAEYKQKKLATDADDETSAVYSSCMAEVKKTLGIGASETVDDLAKAAAKCLCYSRNGSRYGYDANVVQLKTQEYQTKILQWRKVKLDEWLATNTDPILAQLIANFKADDPGLLNVQTVYTQRVTDVKTVSEATVKDMLGVNSLSGLSAEAAICLSVAKLAPACGLDANVVQAKMSEYDSIVRECKRRQLDSDCSSKTGVYTACAAEVCSTLGLTTIPNTDALAIGCAEALCRGRHGERYGYDANYCQLKMQEYAAKVLQWRKVKLDDAMKVNTDPVLALLVANFNGDDTALVNAFATYTNRINTVKDTVSDAILAKHHWSFARKTATYSSSRPNDCIRILSVVDGAGMPVQWSVAGSAVTAATGATTTVYTSKVSTADWPAVVKSAYVAACAAEIAQTVTGNQETSVQVKAQLDKLAADRLREAVVSDLNEDGSGSEIVRDVKNVIKAEFHLGDSDLDESATALAERIARNLDAARLEVLSAHNWNFARVTQQVAAYETPDHAFAFTRPTDALRISSVRSHDDCILGYTIDGTSVNCMEMPHTVTYVSDMPEPDDFPPLVRRALVYRLASDVAVSLPQRKGDPSVLLALYKEKLAAAATADARESNPGRNAWGRGSYVDSMRGRFPRERAYHPFRR